MRPTQVPISLNVWIQCVVVHLHNCPCWEQPADQVSNRSGCKGTQFAQPTLLDTPSYSKLVLPVSKNLAQQKDLRYGLRPVLEIRSNDSMGASSIAP